MKRKENDLGLERQQILNEFFLLRMCCFLKGLYLCAYVFVWQCAFICGITNITPSFYVGAWWGGCPHV